MQNILSKIFNSNKTKPPKSILHSFEKIFGHSINVEWHKESENFEALFYIDEMEHIALFTPDGHIVVQKINLLLTSAPLPVAAQAKNIGEMMNLIKMVRNGTVNFEVIARDLYLDRYYLLLDEDGQILEKRKL
jgi:hypothetical protein